MQSFYRWNKGRNTKTGSVKKSDLLDEKQQKYLKDKEAEDHLIKKYGK